MIVAILWDLFTTLSGLKSFLLLLDKRLLQTFWYIESALQDFTLVLETSSNVEMVGEQRMIAYCNFLVRFNCDFKFFPFL